VFRTPRATTRLLSTATTVLRLTCVGLTNKVLFLRRFADWGGVVGRAALDCWADLSVWLAEESRMASRVLVSRRSRCVCARGQSHRLSALHSVREPAHRRSNLGAEQFDSFADAIIAHSTGPSTPTEVKGSATESELRLSVAGQAGVNLMDFLQAVQRSNRKVQGRAGAACEAAGIQRSDV